MLEHCQVINLMAVFHTLAAEKLLHPGSISFMTNMDAATRTTSDLQQSGECRFAYNFSCANLHVHGYFVHIFPFTCIGDIHLELM